MGRKHRGKAIHGWIIIDKPGGLSSNAVVGRDYQMSVIVTGRGRIVTGIIALAHSMGLQVVAEGVETEEQLDRLRHLRCDLAQGYHFSEPVTDAEFDRFLGRTWTPSGVSPN